MEGILGFFCLVAIAIMLWVIRVLYQVIRFRFIKRRYKSVIRALNRFGYTYHSYYYDYYGKGSIYRKQLDKATIDSLLLRCGYEPLELNTQFKVFDYIVIMEYPEWEKQYYGEVIHHGWLVHFYMLEVKVENKFYQRPFQYYLADTIGRYVAHTQTISEFEINNPEIIDYMVSSDINSILQTFSDDEVKYWEHKLLKRTKNK